MPALRYTLAALTPFTMKPIACWAIFRSHEPTSTHLVSAFYSLPSCSLLLMPSYLGDKDVVDGEHGPVEEGENDQEAGTARKRKRKARLDTIERNPSSLLVEDFGFGEGLDPLFRKLSSSFDESGARGLLLNQLPTNRHVEVRCWSGSCGIFVARLNLAPTSLSLMIRLSSILQPRSLLLTVRMAKLCWFFLRATIPFQQR